LDTFVASTPAVGRRRAMGSGQLRCKRGNVEKNKEDWEFGKGGVSQRRGFSAGITSFEANKRGRRVDVLLREKRVS
jgi:hypothetical protein